MARGARGAVRVSITGEESGLRRSTRDAERDLGRLEKSGKRTGKALAAGAKIGGAAVGGGLVIGLTTATKAAIEAEKSQARLQAQLKASGISYKTHAKQIDEVIQKHSQLSGLDDEDLQDSFTNIVRVTGDVNKSLKLTGLAADFARAKHIDVAKAGEIVGKVAGGNTGILSRYGIAIDKGASSSEALGVLQQKFAGQAKAYGDTTAGSIDRLKVAGENLAESVGSVVTPALGKAANATADFVTQMQTGQGAGGRFAARMKVVGNEVSSSFKSITRGIDINGQDLRRLANIMSTVFGPTVTRIFGAVRGTITGILRTIGGAIKVFTAVLSGDWRRAWQGIKQMTIGYLQGLLSLIKGIYAPFRGAAVAIGNALKTPITAAFAAIKKVAGDSGAFILRTLDKILGGFSSMISEAAKVPIIGKKFKGLADEVDGAREKLRGTADQLDRIGEKKTIKVNVKATVSLVEKLTGQAVDILTGKGGSGMPIDEGIAQLAKPKALKMFGKSGGGGTLGAARGSLGAAEGIAHRFGLSTTSGYRPGDPGWHGKNRARDFSNGTDTPQELGYAKFMAATFGSKLLELIHTPLGYGIKNGKKVPLSFWGSRVNAMHHNHVHVAMQRGGTIPGRGDGDKVPVLAEPGEGFINKRAVKALGGTGAINAINKAIPRFQKGGAVTAAKAAFAAGFRGNTLLKMVAIAGRESRYNPRAQNLKYPDHSIGLWQINQLAHKGRFGTDSQLMDPLRNARAAFSLFRASGFQPWTTRNSYQGYLGQARAAIAAITGKGGKVKGGTGKTGSPQIKDGGKKKNSETGWMAPGTVPKTTAGGFTINPMTGKTGNLMSSMNPLIGQEAWDAQQEAKREAQDSAAQQLLAAIQELARLQQQTIDEQKMTRALVDRQGPQIMAAFAAMVSGDLGGKLGLGIQTPGFAGATGRY